MLIKPDDREVIPPDLADHLLDKHNNRNRPVREKRVPDYAGRLDRGEWMLNGETVTFDNTIVECDCGQPFGNVIDGQTRLRAIVASGVPMETFVIIGLDPEVRSTVGGGIMRQFSDDLAILGVADAYHKASIMRAAWLWDRTFGLAQLGRENVTRVGLGEQWSKYEASVEEAAPAKKWADGTPITTGDASLFWWLLRRRKSDPAMIERFFAIFRDGSQDPGERNIVRLRRYLETPHYSPTTGRRITHPKQVVIYLLILAWNDWLAPGEKPPHFGKPKSLTDPFPEPVTVSKAGRVR